LTPLGNRAVGVTSYYTHYAATEDGGELPNPVIIEDYDPRWPQLFEMLRSRIAAVLDELAISIEHVGSTAVPGLAAKPVIDIDVLLKSSTDVAVVIRKLADLGYEHRGDLGVSGREAFRANGADVQHHLYVCPPGSLEYDRHIAFRNYLRAHAADANAYALLKRQLASKFGSDRQGYNEAKSDFVQRILQRVV
jgi:GrpB-like predicted nucleotidyltransferase (UPF0157 family)